jgi:hypothetical protein
LCIHLVFEPRDRREISSNTSIDLILELIQSLDHELAGGGILEVHDLGGVCERE